MKKGFAFTITFFTLAFLILTLSLFLYSFTTSSSKRAVEISSLDRINTLSSSIEASAKKIFNSHSAITITSTEVDSITITENIPNDITSFNTAMQNFKTHIESSFTDTTLDLDPIKTTLPLLIYPNLVLYNHDFANRNISIIPQELNLKGYTITITTSYSISSCDTVLTSGTFPIQLTATGSGSTSCSVPLTNIDPTKPNMITIKSGGNKKTTLYFDNPQSLLIGNLDSSQITISTKIKLDQSGAFAQKTIFVTYPESILSIDLPQLNVKRRSTITLYP